MRILLINPPVPHQFRMFDYADEAAKAAIVRRILVGPPLALNELAGMLPEDDIVILDQKAELDNSPSYDYIAAVVSEIERFRPEIVGFTCLTAQFNSVWAMISEVKAVDPSILTLVGGIHPTACPGDFAGSGVDILFIGLGKTTFAWVVAERKKNGASANYGEIPGLALRKGTGFLYTRSLAELSLGEYRQAHYRDDISPNRSLTDKYDYMFAPLKKRIHYLSTTQGCTHKCNFCTLWGMTDGRFLCREASSIIDEIKTMDKYPVIRFCDANTLGDVSQSMRLFERIIEESLNKHIYFADVRTDTVVRNPELIKKAVSAGLKVVVCGVEATTDEELSNYDKGSSVETTIEAFRILNEAGIYVNGNYIVHPGYQEADFDRLERFVTDNPIFHAGFTILTPFPGTKQWEDMQDEIVIKNYDFYNLTNAVTRTALPEREFYSRLSELFKISSAATRKYNSIYGAVDPRAVTA